MCNTVVVYGDRNVVRNLCLLQVLNWQVQSTMPESVQLFTDFCAVCYWRIFHRLTAVF